MITPQYLAGLIDGEGYLGLLPSKNKGLKNPSYEPVVKIGMTGHEVLPIFNQLIEQYGGHIDKKRVLTKGSRQAFTYILKSRKKVSALLADIEPFMVVKKKQVELLSQFCSLPNTHTLYKSYDPKVLELKIDLYNRLKALKLPQPLAETN
jgi:hypothetical protein